MLKTTVLENNTFHVIIEDTATNIEYEYHWGKEPPDGQTKEEYLENCKQEAILLTEEKIVEHTYTELPN